MFACWHCGGFRFSVRVYSTVVHHPFWLDLGVLSLSPRAVNDYVLRVSQSGGATHTLLVLYLNKIIASEVNTATSILTLYCISHTLYWLVTHYHATVPRIPLLFPLQPSLPQNRCAYGLKEKDLIVWSIA
jgi:hypothetical protein